MDRHESDRAELERLARRAMAERNLWTDFSAEVKRHVGALDRPGAAAAGDARDLTDLAWCSIDNDDSRDLDQLTWAERKEDGAIRVRVAVADVDSLVGRDSPVDRHAEHNTTSVYTAAKTFPMLPERLCTDLTSLNPGEDRAAIVSEFHVGGEGRIFDESVFAAVVTNTAKLAYPSVGDWLDGLGPLPAAARDARGLDSQLRLQDEAARMIEERRQQLGALEFETHEPVARFDADRVVEFTIRPRNSATRLIENFMIAANGVNARFLRRHGSISIHRAVQTPERWDEIVELAEEHGHMLPREPDAIALSRFLARSHHEDPIHFPDLSLAVIKLLGRGEYVVDPPGEAGAGHFGLAVRDYTHSTAPNRRFPDLVTQRLIKAVLAGTGAPYDPESLDRIAAHCTRQEDNADKVERRLRKSAAALLLDDRIGSIFDGIVTGAAEKGTWVRVLDPPVEGKVVRGARGLRVGRRIQVKLLRTRVELGYLDFGKV